MGVAGKPQVAKCTGQPIFKREIVKMINQGAILIKGRMSQDLN